MNFYCVMLYSIGSDKMRTIKLVRELGGYGLAEAKNLVENTPSKIVTGLTEEEAKRVEAAFNSLGDRVQISRDYDATVHNVILERVNIEKELGIYTEYSNSGNINVSFDQSNKEKDIELKKATDEFYKSIYKDSYGAYADAKNTYINQSAASNQAYNNQTYSNQTYSNAQGMNGAYMNRAQMNQRYSNANMQNYMYTQRNKSVNSNKVATVVICMSIMFGLFMAGTIIYSVYAGVQRGLEQIRMDNDYSYTYEPDDTLVREPSDELYGPNKDMELQDYMGTFAAWNLFANDAFGKDFVELSNKELSKVIAFEYDHTDDTYNYDIIYMTYTLEDGTKRTVPCPDVQLEVCHFTIFENLESLDSFELKDMPYYSFYSFPNLKHLGLDNCSMGQLPEHLDTTNLESLRIGWVGDNAFSKYPNLEILDAEVSGDEALAGFDELESLKSLTIRYENGNFDAKNIQKLTELEELVIDCANLKDIKFVEKMNNLKTFGICRTAVKDISSLSVIKDQLDELVLLENWGIEDYSIVGEITGLTKLTIEDDSSSMDPSEGTFPDLSGLTNLVELNVGRLHDGSSLSSLTNIEVLTFRYLYTNNVDFLLDMPKLRELTIYDGSLYHKEIYTIGKCDSIERLCLSSTFVWDDISMLFDMPNLKWLELYDASFGIVTDRINPNSSIEYLDLERVRLYELDSNGEWFWENEIIELSNMADTFGQLEALRFLIIPSHDFDDVECLTNNDNLLFLDISGNYITDLTPIKDLPLEYINANNNQIYDYAGFEDITEQ